MKNGTDVLLTALVVALGFLGVVALFAAFVLLGGLIFWLAWNIGVVAIVAAAGGTVGKISFWAAVGASLAVGILKRILHPTPAVQTKENK